MATSIVAGSMTLCLPILLLLFSFVALSAAQTIEPTNSTSETEIQSESSLSLQDGTSYAIAPLTASVGLGASSSTISAIGGYNAILLAVDASNTQNVTKHDLAYISCDPNSNTSNINPAQVAVEAALKKPLGIVLYSLTGESCNVSGEIVKTLYSMTSASDSASLLEQITSSTTQLDVEVGVNSTTTASGSGSASTSSSSNDGGPAPTTAVAMSILYSITGIITLLFLVIIATGAVRAHRHPERYGPRNGFPGRPRQSRAKGLARAMLETLPIVKFGDPEPVKPGSGDIELEDGNLNVHPEVVTEPVATTADSSPNPPTTADVESGMGPNTQAESLHSQEVAKDGELGCSICTEDFMTGEDVRVLPCNHKYHPACIDPWLLNVSGTCPLCRHDLRPAASNIDEDGNPIADNELPPPLEDVEVPESAETVGTDESNLQRRLMSRFLDLNRLRHAPPDESIAALRRLRAESQLDAAATEDIEERSRRARLTSRLRDTFRIRTRTQAVPE